MQRFLRANLINLAGFVLVGPLFAADEAPAPVGTMEPLVVDPALLEPLPLPEPVLRGTGRMLPRVRDPRENYPNFITADKLHGTQGTETIAEGSVELRGSGRSVDADHLIYRSNEDEVEGTGNVVLRRDADTMRGPKMRLRLDDSVGYFEQPQYSISRLAVGQAPLPGKTPMPGSGEADRLDFEGEGLYRMKNATYSTCTPASRDWFASVDELALDFNREVGEAKNAVVRLGGVPIFYSPWMSFSLNNERKSGLLAPSLGSTSQGGLDYTQPVYWNIAPNMDATFAPRWIERRGLQLGAEFRYLQPNYNGQIVNQYLPNDKIYRDDRYAYTVQHNHNLGGGFTGFVNYSGVSDSRYFGDLSTRLALVTQTYMLQQGGINYAGGWWNANVTATRYDAPQDHGQTVLPGIYSRYPQATLTANRPDLPLGTAFAFGGEYVDFTHPTAVIGQRWMAYPQLSLPLQTAAFSFTPKVGVHVSRYLLDRQGAGNPDYISRNVPIASLDSMVTLERDVEWLGTKDTLQTLEPRLYYVYIPVREQSQIPVFDTAAASYGVTQLFSENRYVGQDRIGDANQLTAMVSTRLIDSASGRQMLTAGIGQRYYFTDQQVTLPGEVPRSGRTADLLATFGGQVADRAALDALLQYNPRDNRMEAFNVAGRYRPEPGKVLNAAYRYTRDQVDQVDLSAQWPVWGGWSGVGRYNYSMRDGRIVEAVAGAEYDGGCWVARAVIHRIATTDNNSNTAFFFQLELNGFSRIGSNPLDLLKRNIPGYGRVNQPVADPVFGTY
jgi:LPS-assembly protein